MVAVRSEADLRDGVKAHARERHGRVSMQLPVSPMSPPGHLEFHRRDAVMVLMVPFPVLILIAMPWFINGGPVRCSELQREELGLVKDVYLSSVYPTYIVRFTVTVSCSMIVFRSEVAAGENRPKPSFGIF